MKITAFSDAYPNQIATGSTWLASATGSNSGYTGGDVTGEPGLLSVVSLRNVVSLASNMGDNTVGTVLTTIQSSPWVAQFATPSNTGSSSGTALGWFVVTDPAYGATGDGTTDDTAAIQAAIDAAEAAGGGVVYFPLGDYKIAGALQDTGRSNAQLLLPRRKVDTLIEQITIHLLGEAAPPAIPAIDQTPTVMPNNGPVIRSTLTTGTGAIIGAWGPSGSFADFSFVHVKLENLTFRLPADPTNSGVDLSHVEACEVVNVMVDASEYDLSSISQQTTSTSYGLKLPGNNNGAFTRVRDSNVLGYYNGILVGEHTVADNVAVWASRKAYVFPAANHASHFNRAGYYHAQRGLVFTAASHYISIDQLNIEHADTGSFVTTYDIDDASNYGKGYVNGYHVVLQNTGPDTTFTVNSATGIYTKRLGLDPFGSTTFATPAIVLGTAAAAGAATTVIRSDATIVAFDATAPTTAAFSDAAATGSAAYAARRDHVHGMPAAPGGIGEILISDTPAGSPLVFADLIQNEAQDDLVYADPT